MQRRNGSGRLRCMRKRGGARKLRSIFEMQLRWCRRIWWGGFCCGSSYAESCWRRERRRRRCECVRKWSGSRSGVVIRWLLAGRRRCAVIVRALGRGGRFSRHRGPSQRYCRLLPERDRDVEDGAGGGLLLGSQGVGCRLYFHLHSLAAAGDGERNFVTGGQVEGRIEDVVEG